MTAALTQARELHRAGRNAEALVAVSGALDISPSAEAWDLKGDVLLGLGQASPAVEAYTQAVNLDPRQATYRHDLGRALLAIARFAEAEAALSQAAAMKPEAWDIPCDLGTALLEQGKTAEALTSFTQALRLKPDAAIAHFNQGSALRDLGRLDEAEAAFHAALGVDPRFLSAMISLIALLGDRGHLDAAERWFKTAVALAPAEPQIHQARALALLRHGKLREGFAAYTSRFQASRFGLRPRPFPGPPWRGEDLTDRTILIWTEQGLGDEILSAGMFADVIAAAKSCTIECSARAQPLFQRSFPNIAVVAQTDPPGAATQKSFDFQTPALSLGGFLRPDFEHFPARPSYLRADPDLTVRLRRSYATYRPGAPIIGIAWDSTARHGVHKRIAPEHWAPILARTDATFVSLQYGVAAGHADLQRFGAMVRVDENVDALHSLEASAAQVAAMDLVITVSNTTAHLAGALGVPVWTLLADGPGCFWYWFRDRANSPWYPSMRLFRQPRPGAWTPVVAEVARALVEFQPQGRL